MTATTSAPLHAREGAPVLDPLSVPELTEARLEAQRSAFLDAIRRSTSPIVRLALREAGNRSIAAR